jgi:hypothetical protein
MKAGSVEQRLAGGSAASSSPKPRCPGDHQVVCVRYRTEEGYERIEELGFRYGRKVYIVPADELADEIERGTRFHVTQGGQESRLRVGISGKDRDFVQTLPDGTDFNNLSLLPDCAALERVDRQARAPLPLRWWLIPLALLALTAFFVLPHMPPIDVKWNPPADMTYPTPLGADQLNATANMPGEFVYEPQPGTVLHAVREQVLRLTFHTEPLPSPWRQLAIVSGSLALLSALVLAFRAWAGWLLDRRLRDEEADYEQEVASAPVAVRQRVQHVDDHWGDRDELPRRRPSAWWAAAGMALVILALAGLRWYYLAHPRSVLAQQTINVLPGKPGLSWGNLADVTYPFKLTETQLNAVAAIPGEILYDPPIHATLKAGDRFPLKATFVPESPDYSGGELINSINVHRGTPALEWSGPIVIPYGTPLGEEQLKPTANVSGTWTFQLAAGATPDVGSYDLVASLHPDNPDNWNDASVSINLEVTKIAPTLEWLQPVAITYPTALGAKQLNAQANVPGIKAKVNGTYTYAPPVEEVLGAGEWRLTVVFQPDDSRNYDSATGSANLTVLPGDPGLEWNAPAPITVGTPLGPDQLNARANVPGIFTYTPSAGTVLEVGDRQPLAVEFRPDNKNYAVASSNVDINVKPEGAPPPPVPHRAQFLKNGDFEGGFTVVGDATAVGTHWRHFSNGDYHYGYYDDPWDRVWLNGMHSQLIEIGAPEYDPGDRPNRLSGISQTVHGLIPGQRYTLTLHGIIRVSEGDPNTDNLSYVAQWGVAAGASAAWEDVKTWNAVPWTHVFPYLSAGPVQSYTTTFTAQSKTLTLFIGLLKRPGKGNVELNLNLDGLSLTGLTYDPKLALESK